MVIRDPKDIEAIQEAERLIEACNMEFNASGELVYKQVKHDEALGVIIHTYDKR